MDEDELKKEDDGELKGEVLLPEAEEELEEDELDNLDPLLHKHPKKGLGLEEDSDEVSLDALADEEEEESAEDSYDDQDLW